MPKLIIVRGLPGSGKSTFAHRLADELGLTLIEPDAMIVRDGKYDYTVQRFVDAVDLSLMFLGMMGSSPTRPDCIYADVLPTIADVERVWNRYYYAGSKEGKVLEVHEMRPVSEDWSFHNNKHGVREEDIHRMSSAWQAWPGAIVEWPGGV